MDLMLNGRVAVITGPAKGLGAAVTHAFAREGCRLVLIGRDTAAIEPVAKAVHRGGGEAIVVPCDLTEASQCEQAVEKGREAFGGRIDILVNVAGGSGPIGKSGVETTPEEFADIVTLNMNGCFHTMRAVLPAMIAQRYGKIVNVGGTFGMRGRAGRMAYSASKWGLRGITKSFALEGGRPQYQRELRGARYGRRSRRFRDKVCADMAHKLGITPEQAAERHAADYALKRVSTDADVAMPACSSRATSRARSPGSTCRSTAAGPCCEAAMTTTPDLLIRGGKVVTADAVFDANVAIKDGVIVAVGAEGTLPAARETLDASGLHVLPGAIDVHVHFREPGYTHKEDFGTGTAAAACGGVTTVFEMPMSRRRPRRARRSPRSSSSPPTRRTSISAFTASLPRTISASWKPWSRAASSASSATWATPSATCPRLRPAPCSEGFEIVARTGKRISLHAETASINMRREDRLRASGRVDPLAHLAARPAVVAVEAVSRAAVLAEWTGARIHILHISSADELRPLREAKARGVDITGETCPHYLLLDTEDYARVGSIVRVNPPVREPHNKEPLWAAVGDGTIDMIATDHAPHTREEKIRYDIWTADCGFPGVELQMSLMLTQVNAGRLTISDYVRLSAVNPAKAWGLYPRKGAIQPGADADLAIVDLGSAATIDDAKLHSRSRTTPWHGRPIKGLPVHTLVRGRFVMKDRVLDEGARGFGRSVHAIQRMPPPALRNADATMSEIIKSPRGAPPHKDHAA